MITESSESKMPIGPRHEFLTKKIAIDCEMMRSNIGQVLGRISIVNYDSKVIFDTFVSYPEYLTITNTDEKFSGIGWSDIKPENGAQPFAEVQQQIIEILYNRIVVGHDIQKDLKVILLDMPTQIQLPQGSRSRIRQAKLYASFRDTQKYSRFRQYANPRAQQGPNLKGLALAVLGRQIKHGRVSSVEDAIATMQIYRTHEADIDREQAEVELK